MEKLRVKSGITLIALVITIIVLLILAGVSISAIAGENGIVSKAREAKEETEAAQKKEEEDLQSALDYINDYEAGENKSGIYWGAAYTGKINEAEVSIVFFENGNIEVYNNSETEGITITQYDFFEGGTEIYQDNKIIFGEITGIVSEDGKKIIGDEMEFNLNLDFEVVPFNLKFGEIYSERTDHMGNCYIFYKDGTMKWYYEGIANDEEELTVQYFVYNDMTDEKTGEIYDSIVAMSSNGGIFMIEEDGSKISWMTAIDFEVSDLTVSKENLNFFGYTDTSTEISIPEVFSNQEFIGGKEFEVVSIDKGAFKNCSNLTSIVIPKSVTNIGEEGFYGCSNLTDVYYTGTESEWNDIIIESSNESLTNATIHFEYNQ